MCTQGIQGEKQGDMMLGSILIILELLSIFFIIASAVYVLYALYEYIVYGVKIISKEFKK